MKRVSQWAIAAALVLLPSAVMATAVISETIEQLAQNSVLIVRGRVGQVQPQWDEAHRRIYTYSEVQVSEVLKGRKVGSVLIKTPGGEVPGRGERVAGAEQFTAGQDTVLFLEAAVDEPGVFLVRALAAGKVDFESSKGQLRAVRHLDGLGFFAPKGELHPVHPEDDLGPPDAFLARIRKAVSGGAR